MVPRSTSSEWITHLEEESRAPRPERAGRAYARTAGAIGARQLRKSVISFAVSKHTTVTYGPPRHSRLHKRAAEHKSAPQGPLAVDDMTCGYGEPHRQMRRSNDATLKTSVIGLLDSSPELWARQCRSVDLQEMSSCPQGASSRILPRVPDRGGDDSIVGTTSRAGSRPVRTKCPRCSAVSLCFRPGQRDW